MLLNQVIKTHHFAITLLILVANKKGQTAVHLVSHLIKVVNQPVTKQPLLTLK